MENKTQFTEVLYNLDMMWIMSDASRQVAAFFTGGPGPVPHNAIGPDLRVVDVKYNSAIDAVFELPFISGALLADPSQTLDDCVELAERGLYVYFWEDAVRVMAAYSYVYERFAIPTNPVTVDQLSECIADWLVERQLEGVTFANQPTLDIPSYIRCLDPDQVIARPRMPWD